MKIGVYLPNVVATAGGGFTLSQELTQRLLDFKSHYEFVLVTEATEPSSAFSSHYPELRLPVDRLQGASFKEYLRWRIQGSLGLPRASQGTRAAALRHASIQLVVSVGPWAPTHDIPFITTAWDLQHRRQPFFPEVSGEGQWQAREAFYTAMLPRAARIIVGTEEGRFEVERFYRVAPERIAKLPLPTPHFALEAPDSDYLPTLDRLGLEDGRYLFYPAQFWAHKNHTTLLDAVGHLRAEGLSLPLVLVGSDKGNQEHIEASAKRAGVGDLVRFLGFVSRDELIDLYRGALALTFMSLFGPDNLPPLEAFALGCPVIAADVPGAEEQLGRAALRVPSLDAMALAGAVKRITEARVREELIRRAHERARAFTGSDYVDGMLGVIEELVPYLRTWG